MTLLDNQQRHQATDPSESYIVQAPAGSGKTEILTQRFLRLLGTVQAPEQIIALTFTRKAANEMRERIIIALQQVAQNIKATSEHQQKTHDYARLALARDNALGWQLLKQPARLRVITIDSLCQTITRAIPLQDNDIHYADINNNPKVLYLTAARACLHQVTNDPNYHPVLKTLLYHLDNRQDLMIHLFSDLLATRDQWLSSLYQARLQHKAVFERALAWIEQHELTRFKQTLPSELAGELMSQIRMLASLSQSKALRELIDWQSLDQLSSELAAKLAAVLLTSQNSLRKAFDHHVGLKRGVCPDADYDILKKKSNQLLAQLAELPDFLDALIRIRALPKPHYDQQQWDVLQALFSLLPLLVAHLNVLFSEQNTIDFTAISQQALSALGDEHNPTDLALYLDNQIQHLLVDEFQDTSIQQFQLLSQLVQGWEPHDGRTLFIVGDPMQSIYRFRSAEVGLFLRTQLHGIGPVKLMPLELTCNFRSSATIVNWVNQHFQSIFPNNNDIESGAVTFHPSVHVRPADDSSWVQAFQFEEREAEANALVGIIQRELETYPNDTIAILVRSRRQLTDIIHTLREQRILFQGVDIDLLAALPHIRDIWVLTEALLMPANRLAWLSLLRSPWCGLSLADLHCIANFSKSQSIYLALSQVKKLTGLTDDGRQRAEFVYAVLHSALMKRHQLPLVDWILDTLKQLHLDQVLNASQQEDLEQYWLLLEQFDHDGQLTDLVLFKNQLNALYSKKVTPARLQIMTIHKSKGLEFDCVILPSLGSKPVHQDTPLLRWLSLPTDQQEDVLLVSPVKAANDETCLLYNYLGKLDAEKDYYELQRLLYVATTRAKKRLYLFDNHTTIRQGTFRHLLHQQEFTIPTQEPNSVEQTSILTPTLYHLPSTYYPSIAEINSEMDARTLMNTTQITNSTPRLIGIVAHELLQWICTYHPPNIDHIPWHIAEQQLRAMGFIENEFQTAMKQVEQQIHRLFSDSIGQWLIHAHSEEHNEYELLVEEQQTVNNSDLEIPRDHGLQKVNCPQTLVTRIIDRTFIDEGNRWIIDFKTGQDDHMTEKKYRKQVNEYAALFAATTNHPIHCGLYYLATGHWVTWQYVQNKITSEIGL